MESSVFKAIVRHETKKYNRGCSNKGEKKPEHTSPPLIAVTADVNDDAKTRSWFLYESYAAALYQAGAVPLIIAPPDIRAKADYGRWAAAIMGNAAGLFLTGGDDVDAPRYGGVNRPYNGAWTEERDWFEIALVQAAAAQRKPIFGICRGIQSLNVALGGTLFQDVYADNPGKAMLMHGQKAPSYSPAHEVEVAPGSLLERVTGPENGKLAVNSFHHQAVAAPAPFLTVSARTADGLAEAIEPAAGWTGHPFTLGVQWHPERMVNHHPHAAALFTAFTSTCRASPAGDLPSRHVQFSLPRKLRGASAPAEAPVLEAVQGCHNHQG